MSRVLIDDIVANHDAWIAQKRLNIGSGDIATICGANEFATPLRLWAVKKGREKPDFENDHMWWGQMMERPIAELCGRRLGVKVEYGNKLFGADAPEWATATPDYFADYATEDADVTDRVIVECKNVGYRQGHKWEEDTPLAPRIQTMWQLGVCGIKRGIIAPLIGGDIMEFDARWVQFDQGIFNQLLEMADKFMWHLKNDVPPAPKGDDSKIVDRLLGALDEKTVPLDTKFEPMLAEYKALKDKQSAAAAEAKLYEERANEIKNQVRMAVGANKKAICGCFRVTCSPVHVKESLHEAYDYTRVTVKDTSI